MLPEGTFMLLSIIHNLKCSIFKIGNRTVIWMRDKKQNNLAGREGETGGKMNIEKTFRRDLSMEKKVGLYQYQS